MDIGRRFTLLTANAAHEIPTHRRHELLEEVSNWLESDGCSAKNVEELFYMLAGSAAIHMSTYCEKLQAKMGGEILEREMKQS